jgi:NAD(P)H-dependent FMN reductase
MTTDQREPLRILVFSASLRADSLNTRLAQLAAAAIEARNATVDLASMRDFDAPSYDGDDEAAKGLPPGARAFRERLEAAEGFVICARECNGSMPGVLKNPSIGSRALSRNRSTSDTGFCSRRRRR